MKKIIALSLTLLLALTFAACGNTTNEESDPVKNESVQSEIITGDYSAPDDTNDVSNVVSSDTPVVSKEPTKNSSTVTPTPSKVVSTTPTPTPSKVVSTTPVVKNEYNDNNTSYQAEDLIIRAKHVYWENGYLVADCYVINGYANNTVSNIIVNSLTISNAQGVIASGSFGATNIQPIAPHYNRIHTFRFAPDCVVSANADLTKSLTVGFDLTYLK